MQLKKKIVINHEIFQLIVRLFREIVNVIHKKFYIKDYFDDEIIINKICLVKNELALFVENDTYGDLVSISFQKIIRILTYLHEFSSNNYRYIYSISERYVFQSERSKRYLI